MSFYHNGLRKAISVLVEYVPFGYVFHAGTHFSNTRPVEGRRPAAVSGTQHTREGICSTLSHSFTPLFL